MSKKVNSKEIVIPEYYLCSKAVTEHFPEINKSNPFKSGYSWDDNEYFAIAVFNFYHINKYFHAVIEPYNEKSHCPINFWLREICASQVDVGRVTLKKCRELGIFGAIENELSLTKQENRAYAIFSLAEKYNCNNPIDFINKVVG